MSTTGPMHYTATDLYADDTADRLFRAMVRDFIMRDEVDLRVGGMQGRATVFDAHNYGRMVLSGTAGLESASAGQLRGPHV